ncbi:MAG: energy transducer TonB [Acidobacteria bacterium]|nr:energy transducer TonB [Acidobacteriota bacterium]
MTCFLKRALPFMLTLIIGLGLGSIFGFNSSGTTSNNLSGFKLEPRHYRYRGSCRSRAWNRDATPLAILFQPSVRYTPEALQHKTTGVVELRVSFNADGTTTVLDRLKTLPDGLTEEAERVAERTVFTPEKSNGEAVSVVREMSYDFFPEGKTLDLNGLVTVPDSAETER